MGCKSRSKINWRITSLIFFSVWGVRGQYADEFLFCFCFRIEWSEMSEWESGHTSEMAIGSWSKKIH